MKAKLILALLLPLLAISPSEQLSAHDLPEHRSVIVSIYDEAIEMLVLFELPAGVDAMSYRIMIDLNGNGVVEGELENLAQAQVLLPRIGTGLSVTNNEQPVALALADVSFQDGAGEGADRGFIAVALYSAPFAGDAEHRILMTIGTEIDPVHAEMQVTGNVEMIDASHPQAEDAPVIGPVELSGGEGIWVVVGSSVEPG